MNETTKLCECGCGLPAGTSGAGKLGGANRRFKHGHNRVADPLERIFRHVQRNDATCCWELAKMICSTSGYGVVSLDRNKSFTPCHRVVYEALVGPIPAGYQIDHLCRNRKCVNPAHLEAVTPRENIMRTESVCAVNARKTHCKRGHAFTPENTYRDRFGRRCRSCARSYSKAFYYGKVGSRACH